jgi:hypothetical protein
MQDFRYSVEMSGRRYDVNETREPVGYGNNHNTVGDWRAAGRSPSNALSGSQATQITVSHNGFALSAASGSIVFPQMRPLRAFPLETNERNKGSDLLKDEDLYGDLLLLLSRLVDERWYHEIIGALGYQRKCGQRGGDLLIEHLAKNHPLPNAPSFQVTRSITGEYSAEDTIQLEILEYVNRRDLIGGKYKEKHGYELVTRRVTGVYRHGIERGVRLWSDKLELEYADAYLLGSALRILHQRLDGMEAEMLSKQADDLRKRRREDFSRKHPTLSRFVSALRRTSMQPKGNRIGETEQRRDDLSQRNRQLLPIREALESLEAACEQNDPLNRGQIKAAFARLIPGGAPATDAVVPLLRELVESRSGKTWEVLSELAQMPRTPSALSLVQHVMTVSDVTEAPSTARFTPVILGPGKVAWEGSRVRDAARKVLHAWDVKPIEDPDLRKQESIAAALSITLPTSEQERKLVEAIRRVAAGTDNAFVASQAAKELGDGGLSIIQGILERDPHGWAGRAAVIALEGVSSAGAIPLLRIALRSHFAATRHFAANVLSRLHDQGIALRETVGLARELLAEEVDDDLKKTLSRVVAVDPAASRTRDSGQAEDRRAPTALVSCSHVRRQPIGVCKGTRYVRCTDCGKVTPSRQCESPLEATELVTLLNASGKDSRWRSAARDLFFLGWEPVPVEHRVLIALIACRPSDAAAEGHAATPVLVNVLREFHRDDFLSFPSEIHPKSPTASSIEALRRASSSACLIARQICARNDGASATC